jgi:hypothetical protein
MFGSWRLPFYSRARNTLLDGRTAAATEAILDKVGIDCDVDQFYFSGA